MSKEFKELQDLSKEELKQRLDELKKELIKLRNQKIVTNNSKIAAQIRKNKKTIARIKTLLNK